MIDITNYETWFLLYADNELSAEEKDAVLLFVQQHPIFKEEFDGILQLRFSPADQQHQLDKSNLFSDSMENKMQATLIEHQLLLDYIDDELSTSEKIEVENRIKYDAAFLSSYELFSNLKLEPDQSVVYPNKAALYKRQKTISIGWRGSLAAAASLVIAVGLFWIFNQSNDNKFNNVVIVTPKSQSDKVIQQIPSEKTNSIVYNSSNDVKKHKSLPGFKIKKTTKAGISTDDILSQKVQPVYVSADVDKAKITEEIQSDEKKVSNNLPVATSLTRDEVSNNLVTGQEEVAIDYEYNAKKSVKKPFKALSRKISRIFGKEREESDQVKFIQVANFQFAVSKQ